MCCNSHSIKRIASDSSAKTEAYMEEGPPRNLQLQNPLEVHAMGYESMEKRLKSPIPDFPAL
jgi:hypothetical protein